MQRVTVAIANDATLVKGMNQLQVLMGKSEGFVTYTTPRWQDSNGNLYYVSSGNWTQEQIDGATDTDAYTEELDGMEENFPDLFPLLDITAITAAQTAFTWDVPAAPDRVSAVIENDAQVSVVILGLTPVQEDEE